MKQTNKDLLAYLADLAEDPKRQVRMSTVTVLKNLSTIHHQNLLDDAFLKLKGFLIRQEKDLAIPAHLPKYLRNGFDRSFAEEKGKLRVQKIR